MTKTIKIDEFGIVIEFVKDVLVEGGLSRTITSNMHMADEPNKEDFRSHSEFVDELTSRSYYNAIIDAIEAMVLAHAIKGIDVTSDSYVAGIWSGYSAARKEYGE